MPTRIYGWVHIRRLTIPNASVGIYPRERRARQPVAIDVSLWLDMTTAAREERISGTVDYDDVASIVRTLTLDRHYPLIEFLAHTLAAELLNRFPVERVRVEIHKPDALPDATASVEIELEGPTSAHTPE